MAATSNQWTVITTEAWAGGLKPFELPSDLAIAFRTMHRFSPSRGCTSSTMAPERNQLLALHTSTLLGVLTSLTLHAGPEHPQRD